MFDLNNLDLITNIIDSRDPRSYIIPIYVKIYNNKMTFDEIPDIQIFNPAAFRVGFGTSNSIFINNSLSSALIVKLNGIKAFNQYKSDSSSYTKYFIFEDAFYSEDAIDDMYNFIKKDNVNVADEFVKLVVEINEYYKMLLNYCKKCYLNNITEDNYSEHKFD